MVIYPRDNQEEKEKIIQILKREKMVYFSFINPVSILLILIITIYATQLLLVHAGMFS